MNKTQTEIAIATRRGQRIFAAQRGQKIPLHGMSLGAAIAEHEARGLPEDEIVCAMLRGQAEIPGASIFPPARQLAQSQAHVRNIACEAAHATDDDSVLIANEIEGVIGPHIPGRCVGKYYCPA